MDRQTLTAVCEYFGVVEVQVLSAYESDGVVTVVLDMGIKGCPKKHVNKSELKIVDNDGITPDNLGAIIATNTPIVIPPKTPRKGRK